MYLQKMIQATLAVTVALLIATTTVYGEESDLPTINLEGAGFPGMQLPDYYPASYQQTGFIDQVISSGNIVISSVGYRLATNVLVHSPTTEFSSRYDLSAGKEVGFNFSSSGNVRTITEIWILPGGSVLVH